MTDIHKEENETPIWNIRISVEEYSEVAEAIGQIALAWNNVHDLLSQIFARVTDLDRDVAYAIWNAIKSDTTQRRILRAATKERYRGKENSIARDKIIRLLNDLDDKNAKLKVIPNNLSKNDSAEKLRNTDVLSELRNRDSKLEHLKDCARAILDHN